MADPSRIRLMITDDHEVVREGLRQILSLQADFEIVAEAVSADDTLKKIAEMRPDVLILDVWMPKRTGIDVLPEIVKVSPETRVVFLTAYIDRQQVLDALKAGLRGVVLKDSASEILVRSIRRVVAGDYWIDRSTLADWGKQTQRTVPALNLLTDRERQVIREIVGGASNKDIATALSITEDTVKRHLTHIFDKIGVSSRLELALYAVENHIIDS
jgi:two-component system, NarL family, nitrate/nitrite response regulator NarL